MENTQKTPEQWFQMLKEPYRSEAIANIVDNRPVLSLNSALECQNAWRLTPQGFAYWNDIAVSIKRGETTYLEPKTLTPEQMESGKWYVVDDFLIKFEKIEDERIYRYNSIDLETKVDYSKVRDGFICINGDEKIRHATKDEVLKYFPDEVFEHEPTDWEAKYNELKAKYDQLEPKGEKVYFFFDFEDETWQYRNNIDEALVRSINDMYIFEAKSIGVKKSVLVNETT